MEISTTYTEGTDTMWLSQAPYRLDDGQWSIVITTEDGMGDIATLASAYLDADALDKLIPELTRLREEIRVHQEEEARQEWKDAQLIEVAGTKYFNKGDGTWLCEAGHIHTNHWFDGETDIKIITK